MTQCTLENEKTGSSGYFSVDRSPENVFPWVSPLTFTPRSVWTCLYLIYQAGDWLLWTITWFYPSVTRVLTWFLPTKNLTLFFTSLIGPISLSRDLPHPHSQNSAGNSELSPSYTGFLSASKIQHALSCFLTFPLPKWFPLRSLHVPVGLVLQISAETYLFREGSPEH